MSCPHCRRAFSVTLFPALFREAERGRAGEPVVDGTEAACFFHASRKAVVACETCGRFLCELCDLPVGDRHTCPACLEGRTTPARPETTVASARREGVLLYDNIALALAVLPILAFYFTVLTAPMALFVVLRYWNRQVSPVPRRRTRFVVAGAVALVQIAGWCALIAALVADSSWVD
jgi:hypothetical protein